MRKSRDTLEAEVQRRTLELSQANQALREGLEKRKQAATELREQKTELEFKTVELEEANTALRVLMRRGEEDKEELENAITQQTHRLLVPRLQGLLESGLEPEPAKSGEPTSFSTETDHLIFCPAAKFPQIRSLA